MPNSLVWKKTLWLESKTNDRSSRTEVAEVQELQELQNAELSGVEDFWLESNKMVGAPQHRLGISADLFCNSCNSRPSWISHYPN
jgi:hypothetical protein